MVRNPHNPGFQFVAVLTDLLKVRAERSFRFHCVQRPAFMSEEAKLCVGIWPRTLKNALALCFLVPLLSVADDTAPSLCFSLFGKLVFPLPKVKLSASPQPACSRDRDCLGGNNSYRPVSLALTMGGALCAQFESCSGPPSTDGIIPGTAREPCLGRQVCPSRRQEPLTAELCPPSFLPAVLIYIPLTYMSASNINMVVFPQSLSFESCVLLNPKR